MALQLHGNIKNFDFVRSAEKKGEVEIQDSISHEVLYKKIRHTSDEAYRSQLIDPIPEVLLVEVEGKSSKDKLKKVLLYQPDDALELKDTGILGFEHKFSWEEESYVWKRRNLGFSREIECKMVHGDDPGIGVAIFKPGKKTIGHMTILYFNLERIGVNDKRGLEYVLLITMFSFLDKLEDENLGKKKNAAVSDSNETVKDERSEGKKKEKKKKSSEKKEQMERRLAEENEAKERERERRLAEENEARRLAEENEAKRREMERQRLAKENEVRRREVERRDEERLRKQQELLRKLKQEKEDQEYAKKLLEEEDRLSNNYPRGRSNSASYNSPSSSADHRPRNGDFRDSSYASTNSQHADSTSTAYSPWETNYRSTYYGNPTTNNAFSSENSTPVTPTPKRAKKKPKEYKNEYGW